MTRYRAVEPHHLQLMRPQRPPHEQVCEHSRVPAGTIELEQRHRHATPPGKMAGMKPSTCDWQTPRGATTLCAASTPFLVVREDDTSLPLCAGHLEAYLADREPQLVTLA